MADYYDILEIDKSADSTQIRASYKRLAFVYHPDRNPGNQVAEERFKTINEAYHVLSDPLKKSRYDARLNSYQTVSDYSYSDEYWKQVQWQRYQRWRAAQQGPYYRLDGEYFKIQGLAFLVFIVIAGFCFAVIHTINYYYQKQLAEEERENKQLMVQATSLYSSGKIDEAFSFINSLREKHPLEFIFAFTHDSLVLEIKHTADHAFETGDYRESLKYLTLEMKYEYPERLSTLYKMATCQYNLGLYAESIQSFKQILNQQPWNLEILYQIGMIDLTKLNNTEEALHYFTIGKKLFKENLSRIYGEAFEIVMDPADAPDIYYDIFEARAKANLALEKYSEAEKDCNWAIFLRPRIGGPYKLRALAKIGNKEFGKICSDLRSAQRLNVPGIAPLRARYCQ